MSGSRQTVVRIDPIRPTECFRIARETADWLRGVGVVQGGVFEPPQWMQGPRWRDVVQNVFDIPSGLENGPVRVDTERRFYGGPGDDARCGRCSTPMADDFGGLIETWLDHGEPSVVCTSCGWSALMGDWPADWPIGFVGCPAVTFHDWFQLTPAFVSELQSVLGGRCRAMAHRL